jgi:TP901 family phage tail tape measure protein
MAVSAEALDIILRLQGVPTYTAGMSEASAANDQFAASSKRAGAASNSAAAASEKQQGAAALVGRAMKASGLLLAAAGVEGIRMAIKFERQMEIIHTQAGASQAEVEHLKKSVLDLAGAVPQSPQELAKGLFFLESVGLRGSKAMEALKVSAQGAAVGQAELEATASALGSAWLVNIKGGGSFYHVMSTLNATVGSGRMTMEELVHALGSGIIPVAHLAGLSIQDIGAALATLSDSGFSASSAAAQLGTALHFLYAPTTKAKKALESIGLTQSELIKQMSGPNGLHGALALLKTHLSTAGDHAEQLEKMGEIFPGGRGKVLLTLMDLLDRLEMKKKQIIATGGNFADSVQKTMEQPAVKIQKAWSAFQAELIRLGLQLEGPASTAMIIFAKEAAVVLAVLLALTDKGKFLAPIIMAMASAWLIYKAAMLGRAGWIAIGAAIDIVRGSMILLRGQLIALAVQERITALASMAVPSSLAASSSKWAAAGSFLGKAFGIAAIAAIGAYIFIHMPSIVQSIGNALGLSSTGMKGTEKIKLNELLGGHKPGEAGKEGELWMHLSHAQRLEWYRRHHMKPPPGFAAGGVMGSSGFAMINETAKGETVWLPGGSSVQPSPATSLAEPRAHTPNPASAAQPSIVQVEAWLTLPGAGGRRLFKLLTQEAAIKEART